MRAKGSGGLLPIIRRFASADLQIRFLKGDFLRFDRGVGGRWARGMLFQPQVRRREAESERDIELSKLTHPVLKHATAFGVKKSPQHM